MAELYGRRISTVLVVEDNVELRYFLVSSLSSSYNVFEARNGQEGLEMIARLAAAQAALHEKGYK